MIEYRFIHHSILTGVWNPESKATIILAPGIPQYIDKYHPLLMTIQELELTLFTPRYLGTWESGGEFSIRNCITTLQKTISLAKRGHTTELFANSKITWNSENIYVLGFSFGALPTLFVNAPNVRRILLCPFTSLKFHENGRGEPIHETLSFLEKAYPNIYRINTRQVLSELEQIEIPLEQPNITVGAGRMDSSIPQEEIALLRGLYNIQIHWLDINHSLNISTDQLSELMQFS